MHAVHIGLPLRLAGLALLAWSAWRRRSLMAWIFWAMIAGGELGADAPAHAIRLRVFSDIFLRLIKTIVAPLILGTLITGIAAHGQMRSLGRMGLRALIYFEVLTTIAMLVGLAAINITRAGVGLAVPQQHTTNIPAAQAPLTWDAVLLHTFPENIAKAVADNQILQVAVFAILFGLAMGRLSPEHRAPLLRVIESLTHTMFAFTNIVMYYAPVGVGAAMAYTVGQMGPGVLFHLGRLLLTLYAALLAFGLVGLLPVALIAGVPIRRFLRAVAEPATIAFATSTSEAALPRAMEAMEALGRAPQNCGLCHSRRLQLQSGRFHPLSRAGIGFCGPGCRCEHGLEAADRHARYPHAHQQRRGRRTPRNPGCAARDGGHVPFAGRTYLCNPRYRRPDGYGTDQRQCGRQLPGFGGDRSMGG